MNHPLYVAVVGSGNATGELYEKAREVGRLVAGGTVSSFVEGYSG